MAISNKVTINEAAITHSCSYAAAYTSWLTSVATESSLDTGTTTVGGARLNMSRDPDGIRCQEGHRRGGCRTLWFVLEEIKETLEQPGRENKIYDFCPAVATHQRLSLADVSSFKYQRRAYRSTPDATLTSFCTPLFLPHRPTAARVQEADQLRRDLCRY